MSWRLGLDLGTNSIGWSVLGLDKDRQPQNIIDMGVRIFSDGREPKTGEPLAVARRTARGIRKNLHRKKQRRRQIFKLLQDQNLFPKTREEAVLLKSLNPYELRARALDEKLEPQELGRVLFNLGVRRGFKSNRKDASENEEIKENEKIELDPTKMNQGQKIEHFADFLANSKYRTLGEYLWSSLKENDTLGIRFVPERTLFYPTRKLYEDEFFTIKDVQLEYYQNLDWDSLYNAIFFQRPLKPQERGKCQFMKENDRTFKAMPCSHQYRILQEVFNLGIYDELNQFQKLTKEQHYALVTELNHKKEMTFDQMRKFLKISGRFNLETDLRNKLKGNEVAVILRNDKKFGSLWDELSLEEQDTIVETLIIANEDEEVLKVLNKYDLTEEQKKSILKFTASSGTTSFCKELTEKLVFEMNDKHLQFDKALILLGYNHSDDTVENFDILPYYGKVLIGSTMGGGKTEDESKPELKYGKIGNPTVHVALNQTKTVVNALIKAYGKPSQIVVELSRDLKASKDDKIEILKKQNEQQKENERISKNICDIAPSIKYPNRDDRRKFKLWEELGSDSLSRCCLYCGKNICASELFTKNIEIEHILPFSRTFMDSESNLTVAHAHCNAKKGEHTPFEAFGSIEDGDFSWSEIMNRVNRLRSSTKKSRFAPDAMQKFEKDNGFLMRQLNDNRYLSKVARKYLTCLMENPADVWVIPGGMTAMLRNTWQIDSILKRKIGDAEIVHFGLKEDEIGKIHKNRYDHRHHALDSMVIALVDRSLLQEISTKNARKQKHRIEFPELPFARNDIVEKVKNIVVSFKPDHGIEGKLSKETLLGKIKQEVTIDIKDLKETDISNIKNDRVRDAFEELLAERDNFTKVKKELQDVYPTVKVFTEIFVARTPISSLKTEKNVGDIIDLKIKKRLQDYIALHSSEKFEKIMESFSNETGIKKVRCKTQMQKPIEILPSGKNPLDVPRYLNPEDYYAAIIWQIPPEKEGKEPKYVAQYIRRTDIDKNKQAIEEKPHPSAKKICQLHKNDYIEFSQDGIWKKARIAGYSATRNKMFIQPIYSANTTKDWIIATNEIVLEKGWQDSSGEISVNVLFGKLKAKKITVSPIGCVKRK